MTDYKALHLPDLLKLFPWGWSKNPYLEEVGPKSASWINSFRLFDGETQKRFMESDNELLAAYTFPYASIEDLRIACDFSNVLFVIDEVTDIQSGEDAIRTGNVVLSAMKNENCDATPVVQLVKEFRASINSHVYPNSTKRFLSVFSSYLNAVAQEAEGREQNIVLDIDAFIVARRENSAIRTFFSVCEIANNIDLPDVVFEHPVFLNCYWAAADMVCHANDLYSYKVEKAHGLERNNIITVLMQYNTYTTQDAADEVGRRFQSLINRFVSNKMQMPSFVDARGGYTAIDEDVRKYISALEQWVIGNVKWSFDTLRYFGQEHEEVGKTLLVHLI